MGDYPGYKVTTISSLEGRPPKSYEPGRVCVQADCITKLSIYNKSPYCRVHRPFKRPRLRGRKDADPIEYERKIQENEVNKWKG